MNDNYVVNIELEVIEGKPTVSSLDVAEHFGKRHKNILQIIKQLEKDLSGEFTGLNFQPMFQELTVGNGATRKSPYYLLTRDAFTLLVMGFTGKEALAWKVKYIEAFNFMEKTLLERPGETKLEVPILLASNRLPEAKSKGFSQKQLTEANGLIAFWSYLEGVTPEAGKEHIATALKSPQLETISKTDFEFTMFMLERILFRVIPTENSIPATEAELSPLRGLLDYCGNFSEEFDQDFVERVICTICNVEEIEELTAKDVQKALFALWGFINRYKKLYSNHLRKACEIVAEDYI